MKSERSKMRYRGTRCLNCEHPLDVSDCYCPSCGQLNSTKKLTFNDFFNEFFSGWLAYDSRIMRTLFTLLLFPGKISKEYIAGKRVRYANPFKFYLSASILFFILWNLTNSLDDFGSLNDGVTNNYQELSQEEIDEMQKELEVELQQVPALSNSPIQLNSLLADRIKNPANYQKDYISQDSLQNMGFFNSLAPQSILYYNFHRQTSIRQPARALDSLQHDNSNYNRWVYKKVTDFYAVRENPGIFWSYFVNKLPFIIFFFLPVFTLFIWLLYIRRPFNYMEHLIFTFHVQTTFFVITGLAIIFDSIFNTEFFADLVLFLFLFYLYKALRKFYGQGRFKTIVKFILLNVIFLTLAVIGVIISLMASFAIF